MTKEELIQLIKKKEDQLKLDLSDEQREFCLNKKKQLEAQLKEVEKEEKQKEKENKKKPGRKAQGKKAVFGNNYVSDEPDYDMDEFLDNHKKNIKERVKSRTEIVHSIDS